MTSRHPFSPDAPRRIAAHIEHDDRPYSVIALGDIALPLASIDALRQVEAQSAHETGSHVLMGRAGAAVAAFIEDALREAGPCDVSRSAGVAGNGPDSRSNVHGADGIPDVAFFAGPGNNGGDTLIAATALHQRGVGVHVCLPIEPAGGDASWALLQARDAGVPIATSAPDERTRIALRTRGWYVDGLFGIGVNRVITAPFDDLVLLLQKEASHGANVLAIDIPSGLDAMTGRPAETTARGDDPQSPDAAPGPSSAARAGQAPLVVRATHTLAMLGVTPGLVTGQGSDYRGTLLLAPLGTHAFAASPWQLNAPTRFVDAFPARRSSANKGTFGSVAIIGGDTGTSGAVILAARAALYCGAGKVHAALLGTGAPPYDPPHPEIMIRSVDTLALDTMEALAVGPGLGTGADARRVLDHLLTQVVGPQCHAVLDADALNLIAHDSSGTLVDKVRRQGAYLVITPHPGEAARLLGTGTPDIERDRLAAARALVARYGCTVVLKGSGTLIARRRGTDADFGPDADTQIAINVTGNAGLATGGTGDVLSGVIGAFLAQRVPPFEAALAGTYLHGRAAQRLADAGEGPIGLTAGELAPMIRRLLNELFA